MRVLEKCHQGDYEQEGERSGGNGEKIEWESSKVNTRTVFRGKNKLIGKFKMAAGDMISIKR